jgi:DNA-binding transcriptional LysR family regulator
MKFTMAKNLRGVDLNLLVVFEALVEERSISRAAGRVGLTPSAVSHALQRLRVTLGDDLLVRNRDGMEPTPHAVKLASSFSESLDRIAQALEMPRSFDPSSAHRNFHLAVSEYVSAFVMLRLSTYLRTHAPDISLTVAHLSDRRAADVVAYEGLEIHLSVEGDAAIARPVQTQRLLEDTSMLLMRRDHPACKGKLSLDRYLQLPHIKITSLGNATDNRLAQMGVSRRVMMKVPSLNGVLAMVEASDLVVQVPRHWMSTLMIGSQFVMKPLPFGNFALYVDAVWHPRNEHDSGHRWFRGVIADLFKKL